MTTRKTLEEVHLPEQFKLYERGSREMTCKRALCTPNILKEACNEPVMVNKVNLGSGMDPK